uniref:Cullin family profile domain-containing protein n=1 Tax=Fibrocapsa japonica TaxID=94617 RepID=A0A7S2V5E8_9STRA|mmetsp:Transcript_3781/g.5614  ORF Transcript_3781/g.5614 Transcript_3781/m.5614 type:complete len:294 (+) Transcript_3781:2-883(+)
MIGKLKLRCGSQFTSKMEGMMNDLAVGVDHQADFQKYLKEQQAGVMGKMDFNVQVLTTGYWPTYKTMDVNLPPEMVRGTQVFKDYYDSKTSHQRLAWMHGLGNATIRAHYGKRDYDLQVTTLQAVALLMFNRAEAQVVAAAEGGLPFSSVRTWLNLEDEVVKRIMHSLSCGKYKVLRKTPEGNTINAQKDCFAINEKFSSPMRKIRIPMANLDESYKPKRVEEDRSIAIEAAIVRIMKARKTLPHQQLVAEVLSQLAFFRPNPKVIKRRIEALIDREYLERDLETANSYRYLA